MEKIRDGERQKGEDAGAQNGRKARNRLVFAMICGSGGPKSRLDKKAAGAEPAGQRRDAAVVRSTFGNQHVQNTSGLDHFWKWRCGKSACRC